MLAPIVVAIGAPAVVVLGGASLETRALVLTAGACLIAALLVGRRGARRDAEALAVRELAFAEAMASRLDRRAAARAPAGSAGYARLRLVGGGDSPAVADIPMAGDAPSDPHQTQQARENQTERTPAPRC